MRELLARLDSRELAEWLAFYNLEPFGDVRADYRSAIIAQQVHNGNCTRRSDMRKVDAFLPVKQRKRPMTFKDIGAMLGGGG